VIKHIGSAGSEYKIRELEHEAQNYIKDNQVQMSLFDEIEAPFTTIDTRYGLLYKAISYRYEQIFKNARDRLLKDLSIIRIVKPTSKMESLELLESYFGIKHSLEHLYRKLPRFLEMKNDIEADAVATAKVRLEFDFSFVLYDVTTLYFESFTADELKKMGFSKDNKFHQPQILIGLIVSKEGFPIGCQVFAGNKFEGHTLLPSILAFRQNHNVEHLTVVADAAMISRENINELQKNNLNYIVGARLGNMSHKVVKQVVKNLGRKSGYNGHTTRIKIDRGWLVCQFSSERYRKDKHELENAINRATNNFKQPSRMMKRYKYVTKVGKSSYELNKKLIEKNQKLLGIKGYITDLEHWSNEQVIEKYAQLWRIEASFKLAKDDLAARPIYHRNEDSIRAHILICFTALCVSRLMEIDSSKSLRKIKKALKICIDSRIRINKTGEIITAPGAVTPKLEELLKSLKIPH
jgi:transposase